MLGKDENFETILTPGNHDFDGGDDFLIRLSDYIPIKTVITNLRNVQDFKGNNIVRSAVYEIPDSVNPQLKHRVLFLGTTLNNMDYYNGGLIKKMKFFENINCSDEKLGDEAFTETIDTINKEIEAFKQKNPNGAVVLLSHIGNRFSDLIANRTKGINLILNGHDHEQFINITNNVPIVSLGKDAEMYRAIKLDFGDDGKLRKIETDTFNTGDVSELDVEMHEFTTELNKLLENDIRPIIKFAENQYGIKQLAYNKEIRYQNSPYANFVTTAIREALKKLSIDFDSMGVNSSAIRGGIKQGSSNLDLLKTFDGIKQHISMLEMAELRGDELLDIVSENVLANLRLPGRNTILQWSDIQVNRTLYDKIQRGESSLNFSDAVKVRDKETGEFVPLDLNKNYKIVLTNKYVNKEGIESVKKVRHKFSPLGIKIQEAFRQYLKDNNFEIKITPEIVENRII